MEKIKEKDIVMLVISYLREEYNRLKSTLLAHQNPTSFQELHGILADHDFMIKRFNLLLLPLRPLPIHPPFVPTLVLPLLFLITYKHFSS